MLTTSVRTSTRKKPMPKSSQKKAAPDLFPKKKKEERRVFLELGMWDELTACAEFHTEVFRAMGAEETVSRNDLIESFLRWALDAYWEDKGGFSDKEHPARAEKVAKAAAALKEKLEADAKK